MTPLQRRKFEGDEVTSASVNDGQVAVVLTFDRTRRTAVLHVHAGFFSHRPGDTPLTTLERAGEPGRCHYLPGGRGYSAGESFLLGREWLADFPYAEGDAWPTEAGWLSLEQRHAQESAALRRLRVDDLSTEIGRAFAQAKVAADLFQQCLNSSGNGLSGTS